MFTLSATRKTTACLLAAGMMAGALTTEARSQCSLQYADYILAGVSGPYDFSFTETFRQATLSGNKLYTIQELDYDYNSINYHEYTLQIWDASNPYNLTLISESVPRDTQFFEYYKEELEVIGNTMAGLDPASNIALYDITDPLHPLLVNTIDLPGSVYALHEYNGLLFVRSGFPDALDIIDISNPATPVTVGSLGSAPVGFNPGQPVDGRMPYIWRNPTFDWMIGMLDISDPANIQVLGSAQASNNATPSEPVIVGNAVAFEDASGVFEIFDFTDPMNPFHTVDVPSPDGSIKEYVSAGLFLYFGAGFDYLYAIDLSSPDAPVIVDGPVDSVYDQQLLTAGGVLVVRFRDSGHGEIECYDVNSCALQPTVTNSPFSRLVDAGPTPQHFVVVANDATNYQWFNANLPLF
ncbi:MAG: hypothetical protein KDA21_07660 [Phycisphaerales bacterium]|nr:hypothetical protein [Phycisphaerales bacterium]